MKRSALRVLVLAATIAVACTTRPWPTTPSPALGVERGAALPAVSSQLTLDWTCVVQGSARDSGLFAAMPDAQCRIALGQARAQTTGSSAQWAALVAPGPPTNLTSDLGANTIILRWFTPAGGDPATSYVIEAGLAPGDRSLANFDTGNSGTQFSAANVPPGTYYVRVRARNAAGDSPPSNEVVINFGPGPCVPPGPPTSLTYTLAGDLLSLSWFPPATGGQPAAYIVQAGPASGTSTIFDGNIGLLTSITNRRVPPGTYFVRVLAMNTCGISARSNEVSFTVVAQRALQFTAPAQLVATVGQPFSYSFCTPAPTNPNDLCHHDAGNAAFNPNGGQPPYHFQLETGVGFPPFGVTLLLNGLLQGTPTAEGIRNFGVCAVDLAGAFVCRPVQMTVSRAPTIIWSVARLNVTRTASGGYHITGIIEAILDRPIVPPPSRLRAEWENSFVGGVTNYSGQTELRFDVNQTTVTCPNFSNRPPDFLRLINLDTGVVLTRFAWTHAGGTVTLCGPQPPPLPPAHPFDGTYRGGWEVTEPPLCRGSFLPGTWEATVRIQNGRVVGRWWDSFNETTTDVNEPLNGSRVSFRSGGITYDAEFTTNSLGGSFSAANCTGGPGTMRGRFWSTEKR